MLQMSLLLSLFMLHMLDMCVTNVLLCYICSQLHMSIMLQMSVTIVAIMLQKLHEYVTNVPRKSVRYLVAKTNRYYFM